jgi:hypothetical protein
LGEELLQLEKRDSAVYKNQVKLLQERLPLGVFLKFLLDLLDINDSFDGLELKFLDHIGEVLRLFPNNKQGRG